MDQSKEIFLPNKVNFLLSKKRKKDINKSSKKSLPWNIRRRKVNSETSKNNIINEIALYIGKHINPKKCSCSLYMNKTHLKSKGKIIK